MAVDPEGARLAFSIVSAPSRGTVTITNVRNGRFTYVPNANANGADSFTFVASDGAANSNVATVTIAVTPVNDAPTVQNLALVTNPDQAVSATLLGSDVDGGALAFAVMRSPRRGTVQLLNAQTGAFLYTPIAGFQGTETFTFRASDGSAMSGNGTVTITVTP
jgi:hypothetical protein